MKARVGDLIAVPGAAGDEPERTCEVVELHGADGSPPYVVRWRDIGCKTLFWPTAGDRVISSAEQPETVR